MAKSVESTAINELIHLAGGGKIGREPSDEVTFDQLLAGPRRRIRITTALPAASEIPSLSPRPPSAPTLPFYPPVRGSIEMDAVTHRIRRPARETAPRPLLIAALVLAAIAFGAASYRWLHKPQATEVAAAVAPAPAPAAPTVSPIVPPAPVKPALVEVQLASEPAGATVTLIDDGHAVHLGTTPLSAALDPERGHDLVFALDGRAPQAMHVEPHPADVSVVFPEPVAAAAPDPEPVHPAKHGHARARHARVAHETGGTGTLMVSSKPPCEIKIDGKSTGLTTPQREIELPAGHHRITLVNSDAHVKQTFGVDIAADEATKLIENLMR